MRRKDFARVTPLRWAVIAVLFVPTYLLVVVALIGNCAEAGIDQLTRLCDWIAPLKP